MRRILRIWPLYFLIVALAFIILPNIELFTLPGYGKDVIYSNLTWSLVLYILIFPNLALSLFGVVPYVSHTWSIGTEEQFYLVWPVILKYLKKHRILLMFGIIVLYLLVKFLLKYFAVQIPNSNEIRQFWYSFPIHCMAIGGIYSILLFQNSKYLKYILRNDVFYFALIIVSLLLINGVYIPNFHYEIYSVLFGLIILNFSANKRIKLSLENAFFNYLGNISYGLYMFHPIGIILAIYMGSVMSISTNWFLYPISTLITIAIATFSYTYFESYFLKFKERFSKILSGNAVKQSKR